VLSVAGALQKTGGLGEQISAARSELAERSDRGRVLSLGQLAPPGVTLRRTVEPGSEDPVRTCPAAVSHLLTTGRARLGPCLSSALEGI
jgi:hypothetical protein